MKRYKKRKFKKKGEYKSSLEIDVGKRLGKKATYETEELKYFIPKTYYPDFIISRPDGHKIFLEVKGYFRYEDQQKMRAVKHCNPNLDIRMYFPTDNKVQTSKMTNSEWCKKYGFPVYIGKLPRKW